jgi:4-hydroxy-4-methyl-2-oxoglutarate aldolase
MAEQIAGKTFEQLKLKLYSAVLSDVLDELGYRNQTLDSGLRPLDEQTIIIGRAFTVVAQKVFEVPKEPYKLQMEAVDAMKPEEVFVVTTGDSDSAAFWGELLSTACRARGGTGAVVDGLSRDTWKIKKMGFPLVTRGFRPVDSKGRMDVSHYQIPIEINGVRIEPGDLIFGDRDGVTVIPKKVENEAVKKALEKVSGENLVRKALQDGMTCTEAFAKFGVL